MFLVGVLELGRVDGLVVGSEEREDDGDGDGEAERGTQGRVDGSGLKLRQSQHKSKVNSRSRGTTHGSREGVLDHVKKLGSRILLLLGCFLVITTALQHVVGNLPCVH